MPYPLILRPAVEDGTGRAAGHGEERWNGEMDETLETIRSGDAPRGVRARDGGGRPAGGG